MVQATRCTAALGQVYEPLLQFAPSGPANHAPGLWSKQKTNFAPRLAIVYSPNEKTSIRRRFRLVLRPLRRRHRQHLRPVRILWLEHQCRNPAGVYTFENAPRFTGVHNVPSNGSPQPNPITYPYTYPSTNFAITWGADNKLKTPYAEAMDFSIQRELRGGLTLEVAYVGRLGRHLLQALDLAEPVNSPILRAAATTLPMRPSYPSWWMPTGASAGVGACHSLL